LDPDTKAVVVNAIYLKAKWEESFAKKLTYRGKFDNKHDVYYMKMKSYMNYLRNDLFQAVRLSYEEHLEMVVVLPHERESLDDVLERLAKENAQALSKKKWTPREIDLSLPQMKLEYEIELADVLKELGLVDAFNGDASFPKISDLKLFIKYVYHKVIMEVDEDGTVAEGATAVVMEEWRCGPNNCMHVNRPFLMIVRTTEDQIPVFMALVNEPIPSSTLS